MERWVRELNQRVGGLDFEALELVRASKTREESRAESALCVTLHEIVWRLEKLVVVEL